MVHNLLDLQQTTELRMNCSMNDLCLLGLGGKQFVGGGDRPQILVLVGRGEGWQAGTPQRHWHQWWWPVSGEVCAPTTCHLWAAQLLAEAFTWAKWHLLIRNSSSATQLIGEEVPFDIKATISTWSTSVQLFVAAILIASFQPLILTGGHGA